jgi:hypothetical protein
VAPVAVRRLRRDGRRLALSRIALSGARGIELVLIPSVSGLMTFTLPAPRDHLL